MNPYQTHVQALLKMTSQYEAESSSINILGLVCNLWAAFKHGERAVGIPNDDNNLKTVLCAQGKMTNRNSINIDNNSRLILSRLRGGKPVEYGLAASVSLDEIYTSTTQKQILALP